MHFPWESLYFAREFGTTVIFVFLTLIALEPLLAPAGRRLRQSLRTLLWCAVGIVPPVALAELGKAHQIWPGHPGFPSGHMAWASAASVCLTRLRGIGWAWITVPWTLAMAWARVAAHAHTPDEVLGGFIVGTLGAFLLLLPCKASAPAQDRLLEGVGEQRRDTDSERK